MTKPFHITIAALGLTALCAAQAPTVSISIAVRETEAGAGAAFTNIGDNGGSAGGIEWINRDAQTLVLDGTWQLFTFDLANDPILGFAGATANSILDGTYGTLEHIRVLNSSGHVGPISLFVDDITNTITPSGGTPVPTVFGDFEGFAAGTEVMFQEPDFSGSTAGNLMTGSSGGVDDTVASRTASDKFSFTFVDNSTTRWVRLTTFNAANLPNPQIRFDQQSQISFWMRGGVDQPDIGFQGPGDAIAEMVGEGLGANQISTYYTANAAPNVPGALALSLPGQPDLPILGGTLASGTGLLFTASVTSDASGNVALALVGVPNIFDVVMQTVFFDSTQPELLEFTNAVQVTFGQ